MKSISLKSTYEPSEKLSLVDWQLYLKVRSVKKVELIRRLNQKLNQVLGQNTQARG